MQRLPSWCQDKSQKQKWKLKASKRCEGSSLCFLNLWVWPGRRCFGWLLTGSGRSRGRRLFVEVVGEEVEGWVGQVGQAVWRGTGATAQRRAYLLGSRDGDDGPLPGQQGGQKWRLGWGAERGGDGKRGGGGGWGAEGGGRWGAEGGCCRWFSPITVLPLFYILLSGSDGDGLEGWSVTYGRKMRSRAGNRELDWEE